MSVVKISIGACLTHLFLGSVLTNAPAMSADIGVAGSVSHWNRFAPDITRFMHEPIRHDRKPSHGPKRNPYTGAIPDTRLIRAFSTPITGNPGR